MFRISLCQARTKTNTMRIVPGGEVFQTTRLTWYAMGITNKPRRFLFSRTKRAKSANHGSLLRQTSSNATNIRLSASPYASRDPPGCADAYTPIPDHLRLDHVVVFLRHGDRAQISPKLDNKYPESAALTEMWSNLLPDDDMLKAMLMAASPGDALVPSSIQVKGGNNRKKVGIVDIKKSLYSGWDSMKVPYAQLTQVGAQQHIVVGAQLRNRYSGVLSAAPEVAATTTATAADSTATATATATDSTSPVEAWLSADIRQAAPLLHLRSSNMCRTLQSLRALLVGLFDVNAARTKLLSHSQHGERMSGSRSKSKDVGNSIGSNNSIRSTVTTESMEGLPEIKVRLRKEETLYPQLNTFRLIMDKAADLKSTASWSSSEHLSKEDYASAKARVKKILELGEGDKVDWLTVKEVLNCHAVHGIEQVVGATASDLEVAAQITARRWGLLFADDDTNRLAIGRFIFDLLHDLRAINLLTIPKKESDAGAARVGSSSFCSSSSSSRGDARESCTGSGDEWTVADRESPEDDGTSNLHSFDRTAVPRGQNKRMLFYSGHDSTIIPLLCALGIYDEEWPHYAAHLELEFATDKTNGQRWVRAVYNNHPKPMPLRQLLLRRPRGDTSYTSAAPASLLDRIEDSSKSSSSTSIMSEAAVSEWSKAELLFQRLQELALSPRAYELACNTAESKLNGP